jgi:hypothetical protein
MKTKLFTILLLIVINLQGYSQHVPDTIGSSPVLAPYHRNVIKFNPTPMLLFSEIKNITLSYERLIRDDQSIVAQAGYLTFDGILEDTIAGLIDFSGNTKQPGFNLACEYRYYPTIRNRRPAPDGLYIGGFLTYYFTKFKNTFDILYTSIDQDNQISGHINVVNMGVNMGYQFIFWKQLSLDMMVFGPSIQFTQGKGEIKGDLDPQQIDEIDSELLEKLVDRFPVMGEVFSDDNLTFTGNRTSFGAGFRYAIQIGYHF